MTIPRYKSSKSMITAACQENSNDDNKSDKNEDVKRSIYYQARLIEGDAQRERKKSRVRHVMTPRFLGAPKSCAFGVTLKMCAIDSTP